MRRWAPLTVFFQANPIVWRHCASFPSIARDIAQQQWHPDQTGEWEGDDYLLTLPYSDERELTQDILRLSPGVYVESPAGLRHTVQEKLQAGLEVMANKRIPRV